MNSVLSQDEINALLNDTFAIGGPEKKAASESDALTSLERDTLGELANISMGSAATTLSALLGKKVEITTPSISIASIKQMKEEYPTPYVIVDVNYTTGLTGSNVLIIHTYDAGVIVDLMMGGDGSNPPMELNDLHLSAVSEAMNQMMGASCTSLSQMLSKRIDINPPVLDLSQLSERLQFGDDTVVKISFHVQIQGLVDSEMMQLLPIPFAKDIVAELLSKNDLTKYQPDKKPAENEFTKKPNLREETKLPLSGGAEPPRNGQHQVPVATAQFSSLVQEAAPAAVPTNLELILDVGLQLSVELGRTQKKIKEILELNVGSIVELDKLAGEPVDILVNGKLLAKGEVVVIDENFGVRVTEILSPIDRVRNLR